MLSGNGLSKQDRIAVLLVVDRKADLEPVDGLELHGMQAGFTATVIACSSFVVLLALSLLHDSWQPLAFRESLVNHVNDNGAFADRGGNSFHISRASIANDEDAGKACFEHVGWP